MLTAADTALHRLILELLLHRVRVRVLRLVLGILLPVRAQPEDDILAYGGRVHLRARAVLLAEPELGPRLALRDPRVDDLAVCHEPDAPGRLDFLPVLVVPVGDGGLCAVFVLDGLGRGKFDGDLVAFVVVGPVSVRGLVTLIIHSHSHFHLHSSHMFPHQIKPKELRYELPVLRSHDCGYLTVSMRRWR